MLATRYGEVVVDRLFEGRTSLASAFQPLIQAAEQTLGLDEAKRSHTLLRVDAGGGSLDDVNWALSRGYQFLGKDYSGQRARLLAASVTTWIDDPDEPGRQIGWVEEPAREYVRDVVRIAVRKRKPNGQWGIAVLISSLLPAEVCELTGAPAEAGFDPKTVLLAHVHLYDQRGGGVETSFKGDKQGLGLGKRGKKRFEAQQMVMLLNSLAHNVVVWIQRWLAGSAPTLQHYGPMRMVRDACACQRISPRRYVGSHLSDCAQSRCSLGICFTQFFADTSGFRSCGHSCGPNVGRCCDHSPGMRSCYARARLKDVGDYALFAQGVPPVFAASVAGPGVVMPADGTATRRARSSWR